MVIALYNLFDYFDTMQIEFPLMVTMKLWTLVATRTCSSVVVWSLVHINLI